ANLQSQSTILNLQSSISSFHVPVINDADDTRIDGWLDRIERKARFLAAHEEHLLADAGADGIDGHQRAPGRLSLWRQRLDHQQSDTRQVLVLASRDDIANHAGQLHVVKCESLF